MVPLGPRSWTKDMKTFRMIWLLTVKTVGCLQLRTASLQIPTSELVV